MRLVVDTNRIIAALIRNSTSRNILLNRRFEFITPEHTLTELNKYKGEIIKKAKVTEEEFGILMSLIFERIAISPKSNYFSFLEEAEKLISDIDDIPFLALCLAIKADGIWTEDKHFSNKPKIKVFRTVDMMKLI